VYLCAAKFTGCDQRHTKVSARSEQIHLFRLLQVSLHGLNPFEAGAAFGEPLAAEITFDRLALTEIVRANLLRKNFCCMAFAGELRSEARSFL
jgi:hypothetical protein